MRGAPGGWPDLWSVNTDVPAFRAEAEEEERRLLTVLVSEWKRLLGNQSAAVEERTAHPIRERLPGRLVSSFARAVLAPACEDEQTRWNSASGCGQHKH